ncbi:hypothetical protein [Simkania sp.]|uniref:hypothetical protein n=1 Tax=Simkania sp. TaxID=34094 RepID=UPI003B521E03
MIKSSIGDNERRRELVQNYANASQPNEKILGYVKEYEAKEENGKMILEKKVEIGKEIIQYDGSIGPHDSTAIFKYSYHENPEAKLVVLVNTPVFIGGAKQNGTVIATDKKGIDIRSLLDKAGIESYGMPVRASIAQKDAEKALQALQEASL